MTALDHILTVGLVAFDPEKRTLSVGASDPVRITRTAAIILGMLMRNAGRLVTKERLMTALYSHDAYDHDPKITDVYVCKLRRILTALGAPDAISTVWGDGWRFVREGDAVVRAFTPSEWEAVKAAAHRAGIAL